MVEETRKPDSYRLGLRDFVLFGFLWAALNFTWRR